MNGFYVRTKDCLLRPVRFVGNSAQEKAHYSRARRTPGQKEDLSFEVLFEGQNLS